MSFDAFDKTNLERYAPEVKEKWGGTTAYQEYARREKEGAVGDTAGLTACFAALGRLRHLDPAAPEALATVRELQEFITGHFYTCTPEILAGLGRMYTADERFRQNIDTAGGDGTAEFVGRAIQAYCGE